MGIHDSPQSPRIPRIVVRDTSERGRGVFAVDEIDAGVVIEDCPVVVVPADQVAIIGGTVLGSYHFQWGGTSEDSAFALGFGSLYNHAHEPNAMYVKKYEQRIITFISLRKIAAGEEITVSYNGGIGDDRPVWFEVK